MKRPKKIYRTMEDYESACTVKWKCHRCKTVIHTPPLQQYDEDDWDDPPVHCDDYMEPLEQL